MPTAALPTAALPTGGAQSFSITVTANPIYVGVALSPADPFTRDIVTAIPRISDTAGVTFTYDRFVNNKKVRRG